MRAARRASELVLLSEDALRIVRTGRAGRRDECVLPVGWLNVVLDEQPGRVPKLLLVARGVREEIAATLGEAEKRDLWSALRDALHQVRNPRFDNAQLRTDRRRGVTCRAFDDQVSVGPIDLIRSNTRLRTAGSVMR